MEIKMNKILICWVSITIFFVKSVSFAYQIEPQTNPNISSFLSEVREYQTEFIPELSNENLLENITSGNLFEDRTLLKRIANVFVGEVKEQIKIVFSIVAISLLCGILKNIQCSFGRKR